MAHFTVTGGNEARVVLMEPFLFYYVNHVVLMLIRSFKAKIKIGKGRKLVSKQDQPQPHFPSEARLLSPQL